jgi:hypothetical protein
VFRPAVIPILVLAALVARADEAWAQRSARASVSVAVAAPAIAPAILNRAVTLAIAGAPASATRLLPPGLRLLSPDRRPAPGAAPRPAPDRRPGPVRLTLVYAAN